MKKGFILVSSMILAILLIFPASVPKYKYFIKYLSIDGGSLHHKPHIINLSCGSCDDGNPCTKDYCGPDTWFHCVHIPLSGPYEGCYEKINEFTEKTCVCGECKPTVVHRCGNGLCELYEQYTCPQDCSLNKECYEEWETFDKRMDPNAKCCKGLHELNLISLEPWCESIGRERKCITPCSPDSPFPCKICVKSVCGDGVCENPEDWCNCPQDCQKPKMIKCRWDVECGFNSCQQGRDTCYQITYKCENGYCTSSMKKFKGYSCASLYYPEWEYPNNSKCIDTCGDGICRWPETVRWCPEDCS